MDGHTQHDPILCKSVLFRCVFKDTVRQKKKITASFRFHVKYLPKVGQFGNIAHFEFSWWRNFAESILKVIVFEALVLSIIISRKIWVAVNYLNIHTVYVQKVDWGESCAPIKHLSVNFCKQELWSIFSEDLKLGQLTTQSLLPTIPQSPKGNG